jgi:hypothetical protein
MPAKRSGTPSGRSVPSGAGWPSESAPSASRRDRCDRSGVHRDGSSNECDRSGVHRGRSRIHRDGSSNKCDGSAINRVEALSGACQRLCALAVSRVADDDASPGVRVPGRFGPVPGCSGYESDRCPSAPRGCPIFRPVSARAPTASARVGSRRNHFEAGAEIECQPMPDKRSGAPSGRAARRGIAGPDDVSSLTRPRGAAGRRAPGAKRRGDGRRRGGPAGRGPRSACSRLRCGGTADRPGRLRRGAPAA